jgi:hypothetical protein
MKKANSKRNRHTGHVNAFKAMVMQRGKKFTHEGKTYYRALVGLVQNKEGFRVRGGYCIVRTK